MPKGALIIVIGGLLAIVVLALLLQGLFVVERLVAVDQVSGVAQYWTSRDTIRRPIQMGMVLRTGYTVSTGENGLVGLRWADGSRVKVGANAALTLQRSRADKVRKTEQTRLRVNWGQVWLRVKRVIRAGSKFEVETPAVVAAVRGTIFSVDVAPQGATTVSVLDGRVEITAGDQTAMVTPEMAAKVEPGVEQISTAKLTPEELDEWAAQDGVVGPLLILSEPAQQLVETAEPYLAVVGRTEPDVRLLVNEQKYTADSEGSFALQVPLAEGENRLEIVAVGVDDRTSTAVRRAKYQSPATEIAATAEPATVPPGSGAAVTIKATVKDAAGKVVPDGTPVTLTATGGELPELARTKGGAIAATLTPPAAAGSIAVTLASGRAAAAVTVTVGAAAPPAAEPPAVEAQPPEPVETPAEEALPEEDVAP